MRSLALTLAGAKELRIEAEGTDLRLKVAKRTRVNSDGMRNMPSGEVFTGPHETSASGKIRFTIPSSPPASTSAASSSSSATARSWP
jgi:leucyl aminopeptidase (aminopeptidase T)